MASGAAPHQIESPHPENEVCGGATKEPRLVHCQESQEVVLESYSHTRRSETRPEVPPSAAGVGVSQSLSALQSEASLSSLDICSRCLSTNHLEVFTACCQIEHNLIVRFICIP